VVVGLAREDEHVGGGAREPRLEVRVVRAARKRREIGQEPRVVDDEQPLALAEPGARRAADGRDDPLERLARDRLAGVVAHHAPPLEDVPQVHYG
jgi:hypothetical protein